jgi:DNA gyrase subunit A
MQTREEDFVSRLFVASTHTPVLFFSSHGRVYKEKVWRLPQAAPQARGKALINILPLEPGELVTTVMPLPEDETSWSELDVMFATTRGTVRRNKLSDFVDVRRSGIIAMKLADGEAIVDVQICTEGDDVLLTSSGGQCIRFPVTDVRVFTGRTSMGVRGIALVNADKVISMSILRHVGATAEERVGYLKRASAIRRGNGGESDESAPSDAEETTGAADISEQRYVEMSAAEQFVLTITERGYGKRSSSYEYRITGRGGKGIVAMDVRERDGSIRRKTGRLIASFPVEEDDQIMLVTNGGQLIRTRVAGIRIAGRSTQGVIVFDTAEEERVVSGLDPSIHVLKSERKSWMPGTNPGMTRVSVCPPIPAVPFACAPPNRFPAPARSVRGRRRCLRAPSVRSAAHRHSRQCRARAGSTARPGAA